MRNKLNKNKQSYDSYLLHNIMKGFKYQPYLTMSNLEYYIDKYPLDVMAYIYYSKILIDVNDLESAKQVLNFIEETFPINRDERVLFNKFRILCLSDKYEEAKQFYEEHKYDLLSVDPRIADLFDVVYDTKSEQSLKKSDSNRYLFSQLIDYEEEYFFNHIKKHMADYNADLEQPNPAVFNADFPLEDVLKEIETLIPNEKRTNFSFHNNFYVFKYDNVGRINYRSVDYFRVVVINGTNKIVTMYPLEHGEYLPYIDLNYLNTMYQSDVKTLSRVERFNKRYMKYKEKNN